MDDMKVLSQIKRKGNRITGFRALGFHWVKLWVWSETSSPDKWLKDISVEILAEADGKEIFLGMLLLEEFVDLEVEGLSRGL